MRFGGIPFGPYVNRNHFAGFAELVIPVALVPLVLGKVRRERRFAVAVFALLPIVALFSRRFLAVASLVSPRRSEFSPCSWLCVAREANMSWPVAWSCCWPSCWYPGSEYVRSSNVSRRCNLSRLPAASAPPCATIPGVSFAIISGPAPGWARSPLSFPPTKAYMTQSLLIHAHNDYLEMLADTGLIGGLCCASFLGIFFFPFSSINCWSPINPLPPPCTSPAWSPVADFWCTVSSTSTSICPETPFFFFLMTHLAHRSHPPKIRRRAITRHTPRHPPAKSPHCQELNRCIIAPGVIYPYAASQTGCVGGVSHFHCTALGTGGANQQRADCRDIAADQ